MKKTIITGRIINNIPRVWCRFGSDIKRHDYEFIVDTGYNRWVAISLNIVEEYKLKRLGSGEVEVADGKKVPVGIYEGWIEWFGMNEKIYVSARVNWPNPILGMKLLNYRTLKLKGSELEIVET